MNGNYINVTNGMKRRQKGKNRMYTCRNYMITMYRMWISWILFLTIIKYNIIIISFSFSFEKLY